MNCTKINDKVQKALELVLNKTPVILDIVAKVTKNNGRAFLVGGAVRDLLLDLPVKDLDMEVHGLPLEKLQEILAEFGPVDLVGKSFGVLRIAHLDVDWAVPRADSAGRHPVVKIDPNLSIADACRRRDLTMNAMAIDLGTFELCDPWNGQEDIKNKLLRAPDITFFKEDPLRLFRVMQFIGRFAMQPDPALNEVCKLMDIKAVSRERIESEFDKLLLKSARPSLGIRWLHGIGRLQEIMPELGNTVGVPQNPAWHPEGDVFEHTMQAIDAAAALSYETKNQKLTSMYAVLCHDLGKSETTKIVDGVLRSFDHERVGVPLAKSLLKRLTERAALIEAVEKLVLHHMAPVQFVSQGAKMAAYKRLALKLSPQTCLYQLYLVSYADKRGRNGASHLPLSMGIPELDQFLEKSKQIGVLHQPEAPILMGKDLIDKIPVGPEMGKVLRKAYEIQIEEGITDKQELLKRIL